VNKTATVDKHCADRKRRWPQSAFCFLTKTQESLQRAGSKGLAIFSLVLVPSPIACGIAWLIGGWLTILFLYRADVVTVNHTSPNFCGKTKNVGLASIWYYLLGLSFLFPAFFAMVCAFYHSIVRTFEICHENRMFLRKGMPVDSVDSVLFGWQEYQSYILRWSLLTFILSLIYAYFSWESASLDPILGSGVIDRFDDWRAAPAIDPSISQVATLIGSAVVAIFDAMFAFYLFLLFFTILHFVTFWSRNITSDIIVGSNRLTFACPGPDHPDPVGKRAFQQFVEFYLLSVLICFALLYLLHMSNEYLRSNISTVPLFIGHTIDEVSLALEGLVSGSMSLTALIEFDRAFARTSYVVFAEGIYQVVMSIFVLYFVRSRMESAKKLSSELFQNDQVDTSKNLSLLA
jgi:hypothetical protein